MHARLGSLPFLAILAVLVAAGCAGCGGDASTNSEEASLPDEDGAHGVAAESPDSLATVLPTDELAEAAPAHDFSLPGLVGEFTLSDHQGEVVVLNFWATWNELSVEGMDALNKVHTELGADGIAVVGIAQDEGGLDVIMDWAIEHTVAYPLVADASQVVAGQFGEIELLP
ncbi:MAG: TlpA family protein disulfide reductase, partial [Bacteroidetes bacterium]|nr:TlpA family protein disulfide reductase [Bacteroidota bacterium]